MDATKQFLIDYWDTLNEGSRSHLVNNLQQWLRPFNTKISILIRLSLQNVDGTFVESPQGNAFFEHYSENLGTNVYAKTAHLLPKDLEKATKPVTPEKSLQHTHAFDEFSDQLGILAAASPASGFAMAVPSGLLNLADMLGMVSVDINEEKRGLEMNLEPTVDPEIGNDLGDLV